MKFTSHEEYGLRCLIQIGRSAKGATIPEISRAEGLSEPYAAKLLRTLRNGGFVQASRGQTGGYRLARPAGEILIGDVLAGLGGRLFEADFCQRHTGQEDNCSHSSGCSLRSLWRDIQTAVDGVLSQTTLRDMLISDNIFNNSDLVHLTGSDSRSHSIRQEGR